MPNPTFHKGFTLIELMITIAIVAILTALALPSFQNFIRRNAVASETNFLIGSLQQARTLALSGNFQAGVCVSKAPPVPICTGATSGRYDSGTAVFTQTAVAATPVAVNYVEESRGNVVQVVASDGGPARVTFNRLGRLTGVVGGATGVEFIACHNGVNTANVPGVSIFVAESGRVTSAKLGTIASCTPAARTSF